MPEYITDGIYLYEVLKRRKNYGLLGGEIIEAVNCQTDEWRELDPIESAFVARLKERVAETWLGYARDYPN